MSYVVINRLEVAAEDAAEFERGFTARMQQTLVGVPGLVRSQLMRPTAEGGQYAALMEFTTVDAFKAWMGSDSFRQAHRTDGEPGAAAARGASLETFESVVAL